jgi:hypothetical protein
MHPSITPRHHVRLLIMQFQVSAWQDGRDTEEDFPALSERTEGYLDELLDLIDALIAGKDHRSFGLGRRFKKEALEEEP